MNTKTCTVRLRRIEKRYGLCCELYAKCEYMNEGGSIKDRVAYAMLDAAKKRGVIKRGVCIVTATSGNTGIALSMLSARYGYRAVIVMPQSASEERRAIMSSYGASVILTRSDDGMQGAIKEAKRQLLLSNKGILLDQFTDAACVECHYNGTARELCNSTRVPDIFICGVGTGATFAGVAKYIKERKASAICIAVEPAESPILSGGTVGKHGIEGIGAGFIPPFYELCHADKVETVSTYEAKQMAGELAKYEGIFAGISSGANLAIAVRHGRKPSNNGRRIATVIADRGERYLSRDVL